MLPQPRSAAANVANKFSAWRSPSKSCCNDENGEQVIKYLWEVLNKKEQMPTYAEALRGNAPPPPAYVPPPPAYVVPAPPPPPSYVAPSKYTPSKPNQNEEILQLGQTIGRVKPIKFFEPCGSFVRLPFHDGVLCGIDLDFLNTQNL